MNDRDGTPPVRSIEHYLFMGPVLRKLGDAGFFYRMTGMSLRGTAALIILGSLASFFNAGKLVFELPTTSAIFGGILFQFFYILAIYAVVHVFVIRARDIERLPPQEVYMLPLGAVLVKMAGEAYAGFIGLIAIGGGLYVWFTGKEVGTILGPLQALFPVMRDATFIGGIGFLGLGVLISVGAIIASYMIAEVLRQLGTASPVAGRLPGPRQSLPTTPRQPPIRTRYSVDR